MYFEQVYLGCLAHASYVLGSDGIGVVVDPQRDVDVYLKIAGEQNLKIRYVCETHLHADFVSGHRELAKRTGADICISRDAGAKFPHLAVNDGDVIHFGACSLRVLHTPGHTPESICLVVMDETGGPLSVLTGDTLFIGDVGRPDLSPTHTPQELAGLLFDSLHQKLLTLPDKTLVYPAHGAGSLCGRNMRADRFSTIGTERFSNYALQIKTRQEFVVQMTSNLPARPGYFAADAEMNREGAEALSELKPMRALSPRDLEDLSAADIVLLDTRPADQFAAEHVPGSVAIGLGGQFASWAGAMLGVSSRVVVIAESVERAEEARMRLARVGIDGVIGYLEGGVEAWKNSGRPTGSLRQITVQQLNEPNRGFDVLDVRRAAEWEAGHIADASWFALDEFPRGLPDLPKDREIAVLCKGGYRSVIACSLLKKAGHSNVINVVGGFDAWAAANHSVSSTAGERTAASSAHK